MIKNKIVVVTGAAGLIGEEFIKSIIESGGIAIMADSNSIKGKNLRDKLSAKLKTKNIYFVELDITSEESVKNLINFLEKKFKKIDALINNAYPRNTKYGADFFSVKYIDFCENLSINLGGQFLTSQLFSKYFCTQGYGNIINIASIYGVIPPKFEIYKGTNMTMPIEYAAIKSSLIHLTKYMAQYFKGKNIRVNSISPGGVLNNQHSKFIKKYSDKTSSKKMLLPTDLSGTLIFLLSDASSSINGQNIIIDDGFSL